MGEKNMNLEAKNTLQTAISDVGYWRWWNQIEDNCQIEFGGVLLLDDTKEGKEVRTSVVALIHYGNAFVIFLDNEEPEGWFEALHRDEQEPYTLDPESLVFDDVEYAIRIFNSFSNRKSSTEQMDEEMIRNAKCVVAATCENVGFIAGGDELKVVGNRGLYKEEDILLLSKKWWEYWKDYWKKRETNDAYEKDYACEVTIPIKE